MGFRQRTDANEIVGLLGILVAETQSGRNDGWTASGCKHEIYRVKCYLDDMYKTLPTFVGEQEWEKERLVELLKQQ